MPAKKDIEKLVKVHGEKYRCLIEDMAAFLTENEPKWKLNQPIDFTEMVQISLSKVANKSYMRFTEQNEWEGETWNFYIPVEGNEKELKKLKKLVDEIEAREQNGQYTMGEKLYDEKTVDVLCENSEGGYMSVHNKLKGLLKLPKKGKEDPFYKGGINKMMS